MYMIFILIQIKLDFDINNDELLEIIWEHEKKKKSWLSLVDNNKEPKYDTAYIDALFLNVSN